MSSRSRLLVAGAVLAVAAAFAVPNAQAVVGGNTVAAGQRTFMAAILDDGFQFCGGSVIAPQVVMTAAHCVPDGSAAGLSVSVGATDYTKGTQIRVTQVIVHPDYAEDDTADVAVLRLASPAPVEPIALATAAQDALETPGRTLVVAGWGSQMPVVGQVPPLDNQLRQTQLQVVGDDDLQCSTGSPANQVCASALLKDSCQGDSGGPLFADLPGGEVQVGIVSSGLGCAVPFSAGLYTEVNGPRIASFLAGVL